MYIQLKQAVAKQMVQESEKDGPRVEREEEKRNKTKQK